MIDTMLEGLMLVDPAGRVDFVLRAESCLSSMESIPVVALPEERRKLLKALQELGGNKTAVARVGIRGRISPGDR